MTSQSSDGRSAVRVLYGEHLARWDLAAASAETGPDVTRTGLGVVAGLQDHHVVAASEAAFVADPPGPGAPVRAGRSGSVLPMPSEGSGRPGTRLAGWSAIAGAGGPRPG